jgi:hypothetical protein
MPPVTEVRINASAPRSGEEQLNGTSTVGHCL